MLGVSLIGSLIALVIPHNLLGLVGVFPIAIGIKELLDLRNRENGKDADEFDVKIVNLLHSSRLKTYLPFLVVATVTFSGGEELLFTMVYGR